MKNNTRIYIFLIILLFASLYRVGSWGVTETSEARYAEISREMSIDNDFIHPKLLHIQHFHKPPVTYAVTALMMKIFGATDFAARFSLQFLFILQIFLLYKMAMIFYKNEDIAFFASVIYATLPLVLFSIRGVTTDAFVNTFVLLTIYFQTKYLQTGKRHWQYYFAVVMGVNFLTKGPVGLIFPLILYFPIKKHFKSRTGFSIHTIISLLVFFLISLSWYLVLIHENHQFLNYFVYKHTVERFTNAQLFSRHEPWWYFLILFPLTTLPWIVFILMRLQHVKNHKINFMVLIYWIVIPLIFFSISSSKRILYVLPLTGGVALIAGEIFSSAQKGADKYFRGVLFYFLSIFFGLSSYQMLDTDVNRSFGAILFFLMFSGSAIYLMKKKHMEIKSKILWLSISYIVLFLPFSTHLMSANNDILNSSNNIAQFIRSDVGPNVNVLVYDRLLPSLSFELDKPIYSIYKKHRTLKRETQFEKNNSFKKYYININKKDDVGYLKKLLQKKYALISRNKITKNMKWLIRNTSQHKKIGPWYIYY